MLYSTLMLMMSSAFLMLRLTPGGSFPRPLSEAEERKYLDAWLQGDLEARNVLIERNLRLVAHIIKKYYTHYDDTDDLISIGTIGLIKGINTYQPDKGVRLATYASKCAENEILMYFRSTRKNASEMLLSDVLDTDGDGNSLSLIDILSEDDDMDEHLQADEVSRALRRCIDNVLDAREAEIIRLRYAIGGGERCANYASAKAGLIGLTTSIAREVAEFNINVNVIPVPTTDTSGLRAADFELVDDELPLIPLGRIAQPIDIANTALFLVSEASNYVTGQIVAPNGGKRMLV